MRENQLLAAFPLQVNALFAEWHKREEVQRNIHPGASLCKRILRKQSGGLGVIGANKVRGRAKEIHRFHISNRH